MDAGELELERALTSSTKTIAKRAKRQASVQVAKKVAVELVAVQPASVRHVSEVAVELVKKLGMLE